MKTTARVDDRFWGSVEVEVTYTLAVDVPCDERTSNAEMARLAVAKVRAMRLPVLCDPESADVARPEIWCYGNVRHGCPKVGYRAVDNDTTGRRITDAVLR